MDFQFHTAVKDLIKGDKGQIIGVKAEREDGTPIECMANALLWPPAASATT